MEPPKSSSILRKNSNILKPIRCVQFTKAVVRHANIRDQNQSLGYICPGEPHQRDPGAPKFEDRSQEKTECQERCAREAAERLAKSILKRKQSSILPCNNSFCEKWHPPECLFYKTKSGCWFGEKCSYAHRQVDEQPTKRSKKNDDESAVAMLKKR